MKRGAWPSWPSTIFHQHDIPTGPAGGFWRSSSPAEDHCASIVTSKQDRPAGAKATLEPGSEKRSIQRCTKKDHVIYGWKLKKYHDSPWCIYHQKILQGLFIWENGALEGIWRIHHFHFWAIHRYPISWPRIPQNDDRFGSSFRRGTNQLTLHDEKRKKAPTELRHITKPGYNIAYNPRSK